MKKTYKILVLCTFFALLSVTESFAQITTQIDSTHTYLIIKNDNTQFIGKILSMDPKEVVIDTKKLGQIAIPKHEIKEIRELKTDEVNQSGHYIPEEVFSTRYFITTNGLPIKKGESYVQWNILGPDFQFAVADNFGLGIMTSWIGMPIIGSAKYSIRLGKKVHLGIGTLLGTGSWAAPDFALALPFGALTLGDRKANISISAGYGAIVTDNKSENKPLFSVAGMVRAGEKISLVFDSFIIPGGPERYEVRQAYNPSTGAVYSYRETVREPGFAILIPGIRWQIEPNKAFQFGFAGVRYDKELTPFPIPMVQWYRKI